MTLEFFVDILGPHSYLDQLTKSFGLKSIHPLFPKQMVKIRSPLQK